MDSSKLPLASLKLHSLILKSLLFPPPIEFEKKWRVLRHVRLQTPLCEEKGVIALLIFE